MPSPPTSSVRQGRKARRLPLLGDPGGVPQRGLIGARVTERPLKFLADLQDEGGLAHLPRAGHHLNEATRLHEAVLEIGGVRALKQSR